MDDAQNTPTGAAGSGAGGDEPVTVGTVVRDRLWGGTHTGTVVRHDGRSVFVAWHGTAVEDELDIAQVAVCAEPASELRGWRGGVGVLDADGYGVEPAEPASGGDAR